MGRGGSQAKGGDSIDWLVPWVARIFPSIFLSTPVFFLFEKIEFFQEKELIFGPYFGSSIPGFIPGFIQGIFVAKTFKFINYDHTLWVHYQLHCRLMKYCGASHIF